MKSSRHQFAVHRALGQRGRPRTETIEIIERPDRDPIVRRPADSGIKTITVDCGGQPQAVEVGGFFEAPEDELEGEPPIPPADV